MSAFPQELRDLAEALETSDKAQSIACRKHMDIGTPESLIRWRLALADWNDLDTKFRKALNDYMASERSAG